MAKPAIKTIRKPEAVGRITLFTDRKDGLPVAKAWEMKVVEPHRRDALGRRLPKGSEVGRITGWLLVGTYEPVLGFQPALRLKGDLSLAANMAKVKAWINKKSR